MFDRSIAATHDHPEAEPSVTALVSGIVGDAQELLRQQITLLKHEVRRDLKDARQMSVSFAACCILGAIAAVVWTFMLVYLVTWIWPSVPLWIGFGGVGCILSVAAAGLFLFSHACKRPPQAPVRPLPHAALSL